MTLPLTKQWLIENYLFGVDLTDDNKEPFPDRLYAQAIQGAIEEAQTALDLVFEPTTLVEEHDWHEQQWGAWAMQKLRKKPILLTAGAKHSISQIRFLYGNQQVMVMPLTWIKSTVPASGQFQIVPVSSAPYTPSSAFGVPPWIGPGVGAGANTIPGMYEVTYRVGFPGWTVTGQRLAYAPTDTDFGGIIGFSLSAAAPAGGSTFTVAGMSYDGAIAETVTIAVGTTGPQSTQHLWQSVTSITPANLPAGATYAINASKLPADILDLIGCYAAILPLNTAGDLIAGAGVASKSFGVDSLSNSVNTTASAENTGYGARVKEHREKAKVLVRQIRRRYHGVSLGVC